MFTALTENNKRISIDEAIPGESYLCPVCSSPVVVKAASSVNIRTHFAHKKNTPCLDNWKHDMSDWHFDWQSKFPLHNREVIVEKDGIFSNFSLLEYGHIYSSSLLVCKTYRVSLLLLEKKGNAIFSRGSRFLSMDYHRL